MTISAKIVQDSISVTGKRITTYELEYPRFCHAEFLTHRLFSRNSASSRAIPIKTMNELIMTNPAKPIHWGKNQAGMQAKEELDFGQRILAQHEWDLAMRDAVRHSDTLAFIGAHKQISNRITEPFQHMKVVMTTTETANWNWLRNHADAQPEIKELAVQMILARKESKPFLLNPGEWHVPYVDRTRTESGEILYTVMNQKANDPGFVITRLTSDEAKMVSASCCAQVSYRKSDDSLEKANTVFDRLINSEPVHASPVEHQATPIHEMTPQHVFDHSVRGPINVPCDVKSWEEGITHVDRNGRLWSANFQGWIQHRQLIPNQAKW